MPCFTFGTRGFGSPVKYVTGWVRHGIAYYEERFPHQLERFYRGASGWLYRTPKGDARADSYREDGVQRAFMQKYFTQAWERVEQEVEMDDFQRFHRKALFWMLGVLLLILLGCWAAGAAGQPWIVLPLIIGGGFGTRVVYHRQLRRFHRRQYENMYGKWKKYDCGDDRI